MTYWPKSELVAKLVLVNGCFATWSMIFSSKSVAQMQHSRNKHTTNHDKNSLNFFTTPLEFTTNPKKLSARMCARRVCCFIKPTREATLGE